MSIPLISRQTLFGNPDKALVQLSPDGAYLAYLAPQNGVLNVWGAPRVDLSAARVLTQDTGRGIRFYQWAYTSRHILYIQDKNGDENWRLYSVDVLTGLSRDLTPFDGVQAQIRAISPDRPTEIVIGLNQRDVQWHDLYRLELLTGALSLLERNERFLDFVLDDDYTVRLALRMTPDGGIDLCRRAPGGDWELWDRVESADTLTTNPLGLNKSGDTLYLTDSRGRDTAAVMAQNLHTGVKTLLAQDERADAQNVLRHPTGKQVQAVSFIYTRQEWQVVDPTVADDLAMLSDVADGEIEIPSRSQDDATWLVAYKLDDGPLRYYLYDRPRRAVRFLFSDRPALEGLPLVKMQAVVIPARDGQGLVAYYSLPSDSDSDGDGIPDQPLPMVFIPHGGPWSRDVWGFDPNHQWLANRGYAVLKVNFRASTGLGKAFTNAGDREWGGKVLEDQVDAMQWAIAAGIARSDKVAIMGGSFGGYSTLAGLTFYPDLYACGVDIVGPSNLITLLEALPPYWRPMLELFTTRVGDHRTPQGRALLQRHSPLTYVERICRPLLIGQGANDPRVKQAESDQIVAAMQARGIPVTYALYPDEGHGFARPENRLSFNALAEAFLAQHLGGRYEPIGADLTGASLQIITGGEGIPGLSAESGS